MYRNRYRRITQFFAWQFIKLLLLDVIFPRLGLGEYARRTRRKRIQRIAISYRDLAIEMGGVLIKVGQFLSTRIDILPAEFINELTGLQDEVPPVQYEQIRDVVEGEFGTAISDVFISFDRTPLAAASLGQVHRAEIIDQIDTDSNHEPLSRANFKSNPNRDIRSVVVKVQRPDIENIIRTDLDALSTVGKWIDRYPPISRRMDVKALIQEFSRILFEEIDYLSEGRNAEIFSEQFQAKPRIRVPKVIWSHTTKRVLTLENVWGIKITDYEAIERAGVDKSEVASLLIDTYFKQIFEDGFFHADPHPGNLFVNPIPLMPPLTNIFGDSTHQSRVFWQLTFVDFGMAGTVPENLKRGLREMLIGVGTKDSSRVIRAYQQMGILLPGADLERIESAGADIFDRFWGRNMEELSNISPDEIITLTKEYRELLYEMPFQIPQNVIFLGRTVSILSGICTGLDPEFNIFDHLAPFAQKLIIEESRLSPTEIVNQFSSFAQLLFSLPGKVDRTIDKLEKGEIEVRMPEIAYSVKRIDQSMRKAVWGIVFAALLLSGVQLQIAGQETFAYFLYGGSFISLLLIVFSGRRKT